MICDLNLGFSSMKYLADEIFYLACQNDQLIMLDVIYPSSINMVALV